MIFGIIVWRMKKETKDVLRVVIIGFSVMFALPAAYRVWIHYNPPPVRKPLLVVLQEAGGVRKEALLETPVDKWTESDLKLAPEVREWLEKHADVILPWEWTDVAKKKDWNGYCGSWRRIFEEQFAVLGKFAELKSDVMGDASDQARIERKIIANAMVDMTNLLAVVSDAIPTKTNEYPVVLTVNEITPGRFWGWNQRRREVRLDDYDAVRKYAGDLKKRINDEWLPKAEAHERERDEAKAAMDELAKTKEGISKALEKISAAEKSGSFPDGLSKDSAKRLLEAIAVAYRHRPSDRRKPPKWLPSKVRNWFSLHDDAMSAFRKV